MKAEDNIRTYYKIPVYLNGKPRLDGLLDLSANDFISLMECFANLKCKEQREISREIVYKNMPDEIATNYSAKLIAYDPEPRY